MVKFATCPIRMAVYFALLPLAVALDIIDPIVEDMLEEVRP